MHCPLRAPPWPCVLWCRGLRQQCCFLDVCDHVQLPMVRLCRQPLVCICLPCACSMQQRLCWPILWAHDLLVAGLSACCVSGLMTPMFMTACVYLPLPRRPFSAWARQATVAAHHICVTCPLSLPASGCRGSFVRCVNTTRYTACVLCYCYKAGCV